KAKAEVIKKKIATLREQLRALENAYFTELGRELDKLLQQDNVTWEQVREAVARIKTKYY
ncbi:MAG: hypothetical protein QW561_03235, partial [Candidatus Aenigmatarchaeota archaeon]